MVIRERRRDARGGRVQFWERCCAAGSEEREAVLQEVRERRKAKSASLIRRAFLNILLDYYLKARALTEA